MSRVEGELKYDTALADKFYEAIGAVLDDVRHDEVLEIEVLPSFMKPPAGQLLFQDGRFIGIPKGALVLAFIRAAILFSRRSRDGTSSATSDEALLRATSVILLHDPEHLSAANWRKRHLLRLQQRSAPAALSGALRREWRLLDAILTSPLHRQTKSPTLWHHRRWLLARSLHPSLDLPGPLPRPQRPAALLQHELAAVLKAASRHRNNYYAWNHARSVLLRSCDDARAAPGSPCAVEAVACTVAAWCLQNPADTSGWSFLASCMRSGAGEGSREDVARRVVDAVAKRGWKGQAVWSFLRTLAAEEGMLGEELRGEVARMVSGYGGLAGWKGGPMG